MERELKPPVISEFLNTPFFEGCIDYSQPCDHAAAEHVRVLPQEDPEPPAPRGPHVEPRAWVGPVRCMHA